MEITVQKKNNLVIHNYLERLLSSFLQRLFLQDTCTEYMAPGVVVVFAIRFGVFKSPKKQTQE